MNDTMNEIRTKVESYQILLCKKEEILKEYQVWSTLYEDAQNIVEEIRISYENNKTPELEEKYQNWVKEKTDYFEIISEYSKELDEINKELNAYDKDTMEEQADLLANFTKFKLLSEQMKIIEKRSKKMATIGLIAVENAEGRLTKINESFVAEYSVLAQEKRKIAKIMKKQYNKLINKVEIEEKKVEVEVQPVVEEASIQMPIAHKYDTLTIEEKIKQLEEKIVFYRNAPGRKCAFTWCGEEITMSRYYKGPFLVCASELKRLQRQLLNPNAPQLENKREDFYQAVEGNIPAPDEKEIEYNAKVESLKDDFIRIVQENHDKKKTIPYNPKTEIVLYNQKSGFVKIKKVEKPKKLDELKSKLKKAAVIIATSAALLVTAGNLLIGSLKNNKEIEEVKKPDKNISIDVENNQNIDDVINDINNKYDNKVDIDPIINDNHVENENVIRLGDQFFLNGNAKIFNSIYDATLDRNGVTPYFEQNTRRKIGGLAIKHEGQLHFFYSSDANAQENVDMLLANGGQITCVLASNANGYEGFYSMSDIVVLSNTLGGNGR